MPSTRLEITEIQGLLISGYSRQRAMCGILLKIVDVKAAQCWLTQIALQITFCNDKKTDSKLNIAFTSAGLKKLVTADDLDGFSREFCEGMVTPHRQRILGDLPGSPSDPRGWKWGSPDGDAIDVLLLAYEVDTALLEARLAAIREQLSGLIPIFEMRSVALQDDKEHFGFRDGLAQPWIEGLNREGFDRDRLTPGEMVLGYEDNTGVPEPAPALATNGTYLVVRQIAQRVPEFWNAYPDISDEEKLLRAARKMGRWPDGTPLVLSPDKPDANQPKNDFGYAKIDPDGHRCPIGSHVRRANPRDALLAKPNESLDHVNRHRILRRGRSFGRPVAPEVYPGNLQVCCDDDAFGGDDLRGLIFICLNASLARQFEFCQQSWLGNPKLLTLTDETDPIASSVQWSGPGQCPVLTAQAAPLRFRVGEAEKYVHTIGGGYFFLPSRTALRSLGSQESASK